MNLRNEIVLVFSILLVSTIIVTSAIALYFTENAVVDSEIHQMTTVLVGKNQQIESLHARASEDLVFALKNPLFVEYFELPETKAGNVYKDGVLQFTDNQHKIKNELEQWTYHFQSKFQVDETCIIDTSGQEHTRLVLKQIEVDENLSPDEEFAPFFESSFKKSKDQVHVQYPYVSPDTSRWVFAYTSPVVLGDGQKPAFYHFEMPITIFQELVGVEVGRMYVIDPQGFIIADSKKGSVANSKYEVTPLTITDYVAKDFFPSISDVSTTSEYSALFEIMKSEKSGNLMYNSNGDQIHLVYQHLPTFDWVLVYEKPKSLMLVGDTTIGNLRNLILIASSIVIIAGISVTAIFSSKISKPIFSLSRATKDVSDGILDTKLEVSGPNEIKELGKSFNHMTKSLKKTIQLEKELAIAEQKLKTEKLATIGQLASRISHDLRNPLTVLKGTISLLKLKQETFDEDTKVKLTKADEAIERMTRQVETVLDYVKTKPLQIKLNSITEIINQSLHRLDIPANISVSKPDSDIKIHCDKTLLDIVFINLIVNAIQAIGDTKGNISVRIMDQFDKMMIEVENSGPEIPDDELPRIFEPLFTTKQEGTGLGLSSCQTIIEQHGGSISAYNNPTRFVIKLPKDILVETKDIN